MTNRKFRKVYLIVDGNKIFSPHNYETVNLHRRKEHAESICKSQNAKKQQDAGMDFNKNKPIVLGKVHGFYLVHESFFDDTNK